MHQARVSFTRLAALAAIAACLGSCAHVNPYYDASKPHHRPEGFQDNDIEFAPKSLAELLRWKWEAFRNGVPKPPATPIPQVAPDLAFIRSNTTQPAVTWIGHASVLLQVGGLNVLTDPVFSERASPLSFVGPKRHQPPGLPLADLPHVDLVVISHNHYDHLDAASVEALNRQAGGPPLYLVPLGLKPWFADRDITNVIEMDWWQQHTLQGPTGPVDVALVPAQHWSGRSLGDRMQTLWGGYAVFAPGASVFFAGDTGYSRDFTRVHERYAARLAGGGFDLALLPIGAYEPRWFMTTQHVNPQEAVKMHRDLHAKRSIGIHWGTFSLTDEALDEPPKALAEARREAGIADADFGVLAVGETLKLR